jgi:peroxiredoxin
MVHAVLVRRVGVGMCSVALAVSAAAIAQAAGPQAAPRVPPVLMSEGHAALCKVKVGEAFPAISLPQLNGGQADLASLAGSKATVVLFWAPNHWMSRIALAAAAKDVAAKINDKSIAVVGVVEVKNAQDAQADLEKFGAKFPQLLDADGAALAQVGTNSLPRVYVLDAQHKIAWFDIEFSEATRRELAQTLSALTAK